MRVTRQRQKGTTGALATLIASRYWRAADAERVLEMWRRSGQSAAPTNGWPPSPTRCAPRAPSTASPATPTTWSSRANPTDGGSSPSLGLDKRRRLRRRSTRHAVRDPGGGMVLNHRGPMVLKIDTNGMLPKTRGAGSFRRLLGG